MRTIRFLIEAYWAKVPALLIGIPLLIGLLLLLALALNARGW